MYFEKKGRESHKESPPAIYLRKELNAFMKIGVAQIIFTIETIVFCCNCQSTGKSFHQFSVFSGFHQFHVFIPKNSFTVLIIKTGIAILLIINFLKCECIRGNRNHVTYILLYSKFTDIPTAAADIAVMNLILQIRSIFWCKNMI